MSNTALITEYNPFHNGHLYHLKKSKEITDSENIIVIMNGNFSQRAEAALINKWSRSKQALSCGADLVIELPLAFGIRSAEYFAHFSVKTLQESKIVDTIVFGSESGDIELLKAIAAAFNNENDFFKAKLLDYLNNGHNYPTARRRALMDSAHLYPELNKYQPKELKKTLENPNNILGIEYLKALDKLNSAITAKTIKRIGPAYYSNQIQKSIGSASLIREIIQSGKKGQALLKCRKLMPKKSWEILKADIKQGLFIPDKEMNMLYLKIIDKIRRLNAAQLKEFAGIENGLENRILDSALKSGRAADFIKKIKSKNYTESRIKRKLLQIYFDLNEEKLEIITQSAPQYIRVLGLKKSKEHLLSELQEKSNLKLVINPAEIIREKNLNSNDPLELSLSYDILASDLYSLHYQNSELRRSGRDYYQKLIKV